MHQSCDICIMFPCVLLLKWLVLLRVVVVVWLVLLPPASKKSIVQALR